MEGLMCEKRRGHLSILTHIIKKIDFYILWCIVTALFSGLVPINAREILQGGLDVQPL